LLELGYARDVQRPVIPVELGSLDPALLPAALGERQAIAYGEGGKADTIRLARALGQIGAGDPLPDPLPPSPPLPGSYFTTLREQIGSKTEMTLDQQLGVVHRLRARADDGAVTDEVRALVRQLRQRDDLYASVAGDLDVLEASLSQEGLARSRQEARGRWRRLRRPSTVSDWLTIVLAGVALLLGLLALQDPLFTVDQNPYQWGRQSGTPARLRLVVLLLVFAVLVVVAWSRSPRARQVASVAVLVLSLLGLALWWSEIDDLLRQTYISGDSRLVELGPGLRLSGLSIVCQLGVGFLLVGSAFDRPRGRALEV
jgi:hypothetical protein